MKDFFVYLEKERAALDISIESVAKLIGVQPITYASWVGGVTASDKFRPQIANGYFFMSLLKHCGLIPNFQNSRAKNHFFKSLAAKGKLHSLLKTFCYFE